MTENLALPPLKTARLLQNRQEAEATYFLRFECPGGLDFEPGQFVQLFCSDAGASDSESSRPFGILGSKPEDNQFWLMIRDRGPRSHWLVQRKPGQEVQFYGPLGRGFATAEIQPGQRVLLVGEAIGVVLIAELSQRLAHRGETVTLLATAPDYRAVSGSVFLSSFNTEYQVKYTYGDLSQLIEMLNQPQYYSHDLAYFSLSPRTYPALIKAGLLGPSSPYPLYQNPPVLFQRVLRCGIGTCGECSVDTPDGPRLACQDGPVFRLQEINWRIR